MGKTISLLAYGTLRKGGSNQRVLQEARLLERGIHVEGYAMYNVGFYPFVVENGNSRIICDLYAVPLQQLERLDHFEGPFYRRVVESSTGAFLYVKADSDFIDYEPIPDGDWLTFNKKLHYE